MDLRLHDVTNDDLPLIEQWLQTDHVRRYWGDSDENLRQLRDAPGTGHWRAIVEADGLKVGLVLWQHPTRQELDVAGLTDIPESVIGCARSDNLASQRAFAKEGFRSDREFDDVPNGPHVLMVRDRAQARGVG